MDIESDLSKGAVGSLSDPSFEYLVEHESLEDVELFETLLAAEITEFCDGLLVASAKSIFSIVMRVWPPAPVVFLHLYLPLYPNTDPHLSKVTKSSQVNFLQYPMIVANEKTSSAGANPAKYSLSDLSSLTMVK